jgi:hypothetical protein
MSQLVSFGIEVGQSGTVLLHDPRFIGYAKPADAAQQ